MNDFPFWLRVHVISLNLIAFIISVETKASLLTLARSIYVGQRLEKRAAHPNKNIMA